MIEPDAHIVNVVETVDAVVRALPEEKVQEAQRVEWSPALEPLAEGADPERASSPRADAKGVFDTLAESNFARSIAFLAASMVGGGSLSFLSGCGAPRDNVQVSRILEKEVKFSTFAPNAEIALVEVQQNLNAREKLDGALKPTLTELHRVITIVEQSGRVQDADLSSLKTVATALDTALHEARKDPGFSAAEPQISKLEANLRAISGIASADFAHGTKSSAYTRLDTLQTSLHDWRDALARDIGLMKTGIQAYKLGTLVAGLEKMDRRFDTVIDAIDGAAWFSTHHTEADTLRQEVTETIALIKEAKQDSTYRSISDDLGDAERLLQDVLTVTSPARQGEFFNRTVGQNNSTGQTVMNEAHKLLDALRSDIKKELGTGMGVETPQAAKPGAPAATVVHHHHGGGVPGWWYMHVNRGSYGGSYSYAPSSGYSYSGSERLRASSEYRSFSEASASTAHAANGAHGLTPHGSQGIARSTPVASGVGHSSSNSSHPSSGFHAPSGGFGGGHSFSHGFGG